MKKTFACLMRSCIALVLAACGGGADHPEISAMAPPTTGLYATGEKVSTLGGVSIRTSGETGELQMLILSGSKDHNTGPTTVTDGKYILTDKDGFNSFGTISDGHSNLSIQAMPYNFVSLAAFDQSYSVGDVGYNSTGIIGIITEPSDVRTKDSVMYSGQAEALIVTSSQGFALHGKSTVEAEFSGIGKVHVTLDGFTATDLTTGTTTLAPIDTISVTDMTISENRFSEGFITTSSGGATLSVTGANTSAVAEGMFFGYDSNIYAPDEVGGMILIEGEDGIIVGRFVAE